jgi:hypothetical protein
MEMPPREHRTRVGQIEVHEMPARLEVVGEIGIGAEALERRHVVIEHDDARGLRRERAQRTVRERDVDEHDLGAREIVGVQRVVVAARAVLCVAGPRLSHRPGGTEAVGTAGVVEADATHGRRE